VKLQVADPIQEQIKFVQSSVKNSFFQTNPLPTNPIDSNQFNLKLWLEIYCALEASWKYFK
jgi:hypothetical protein